MSESEGIRILLAALLVAVVAGPVGLLVGALWGHFSRSGSS